MAIFRGASSTEAAAIPDISGSLGVSTFFVVSGFLMVYVHGEDFGQPRATRSFYARRLARIVPLYWLITLLYGAKQLAFGQDTFWNMVKSLLFVPYQTSGDLWRPVLGQGWTLNYEMAFYVIFGLSLLFKRGLILIFGVFGMLSLLFSLGTFAPHNLLAFWSNPIILYFLAGVAIGLVRKRTSRGPSFAVAFGLSTATLALAAFLAATLHPTAMCIAVATPMVAVCAVTVTALAQESYRHSIVRRFAKMIGDASYSIYLTHTFVIAPAAKIGVARFFPDMPMIVFTVLMLITTSVVGYGIFRFIERPMIKAWSHTFVRRAGSKTTTPAVA